MSTQENNPLKEAVAAKVRNKGRKVPALPTYFFETAGVEVQIRRLGPFTMDDIRKKLLKERKRPQPPTYPVEIGEMRVKVMEENPNDPGYIREVAEWQTWFQTSMAEKMLELMIDYCIVCEVDLDDVAQQREMLNIVDPELNATMSDRHVYIRYHLMCTPGDLEGVQKFILGQSMPTQEAVEEHIDSFPSNVPGEGPVQTPGAPIRVPLQPDAFMGIGVPMVRDIH